MLSSQLREARRVVVNIAGDGLPRFDLLEFKAQLPRALELAEKLALLIENNNTQNTGESKMIVAVPEQPVNQSVDEMLTAVSAEDEARLRKNIFDMSQGRYVEPSEFRASMVAACRTHNDMKRYVDNARARFKAIADQDGLPAAKQQLAELDAGVTAASEAVDRMKAEQAAALKPLEDGLRQATEERDALRHSINRTESDSRSALNKTTNPQELAKLNNLQSKVVYLGNALYEKRIYCENSNLAGRIKAAQAADDQDALAPLLAHREEFEQLARDAANTHEEYEQRLQELLHDPHCIAFD